MTLSEQAERVLAELEEARYEDVVTLIQTLCPRKGDPQELAGFAATLAELVSAGLITIFVDDTEAQDSQAALRVAREQRSSYVFDSKTTYWVPRIPVAPSDRSRVASARLTERGYAEAVRILTARGYRWWSKPAG